MSQTFTATDPAGKVHTRTSKNRVYTHTVVGLPSVPRDILMAKDMAAMHMKNFKHYSAYLDGTSRFLRDNANAADAIAKATAELVGCTTAVEYADMKVLNALERIQKKRRDGFYDTYQNAGWCGRIDLAQKLKASTKHLIGVTILEVATK